MWNAAGAGAERIGYFAYEKVLSGHAFPFLLIHLAQSSEPLAVCSSLCTALTGTMGSLT